MAIRSGQAHNSLVAEWPADMIPVVVEMAAPDSVALLDIAQKEGRMNLPCSNGQEDSSKSRPVHHDFHSSRRAFQL